MVMELYNPLHLAVTFSSVLWIVLIWAIFRRASERTKTVFLVTFCVIVTVIFWIYKYALSQDRQYLEAAGLAKFNWLNELPLQLCNINMMLIPIGVLTKKRGLMGFSFFLAPLGALMATIFPDVSFIGYSLFMPRILGYYVTHVAIIVAGFSLATLGFYRPRIKDIPRITVAFLLLDAADYGINILLRSSGACAEANYFYSCDPVGISILELFWKWIPVPFFYELPALLILFAYIALICGGLWAIFKPKGEETAPAAVEDEKTVQTV